MLQLAKILLCSSGLHLHHLFLCLFEEVVHTPPVAPDGYMHIYIYRI